MDAERLAQLFTPHILRPREESEKSEPAAATEIILFMIQNVQPIAEVGMLTTKP